MGGYAWVTLATNDSYSLGALVLAHSLKKSNTAHKLAVLITPAVTEPMRDHLRAAFDLVKLVDVLDSKDEAHLALMKRPELGVTFTKIHCWRLTEFEKCVFLDADTLVTKNCDELFDREEFSAAPDASWPDCFNSGVFVYKPSVETFTKLLQFAIEKGSFDGGDQGLLNQFFSDWATKDIKKHLPFVYNLTSIAVYSYIPAFKQYGSDTRIVHFIGPGKPWLQQLDPATRQITPNSGSEHLTPFLQKWWDLFCEKVHPHLDKGLEFANGMSPTYLPREACSNFVTVDCTDETEIPHLVEPCTLLKEKNDFRQSNLPYKPFEVKGFSGELLNEEFRVSAVEFEENDENVTGQQKCRHQQEGKGKNDENERGIPDFHDEVNALKKTISSNGNEVSEETDSRRQGWHNNEGTVDAEEGKQVSKGLFEFFPDKVCVNNYLERNVLQYQPFESRHPHLNSSPKSSSHNACYEILTSDEEPKKEFVTSSLPRFLVIREDDKRQRGNGRHSATENIPPDVCNADRKDNSFKSHNTRDKSTQCVFNDMPITVNMNAETGKTFTYNTSDFNSFGLQKSRSVSNLVFDALSIGSICQTPSTLAWTFHLRDATNTNRRYSMPKLKPLLPKERSFRRPASLHSKVTLWTELLMSSDYKDPKDLPKDNEGFVERQIFTKFKMRRSQSEGNLLEKFGPLPYECRTLERKSRKSSSENPKTLSVNSADTPTHDLNTCKRQMGNRPKNFNSHNKRSKSEEGSGNENVEVKVVTDGSVIGQQKGKQKPSASTLKSDANTRGDDVGGILKRLANYCKDYSHYFGDVGDNDKSSVFCSDQESSRRQRTTRPGTLKNENLTECWNGTRASERGENINSKDDTADTSNEFLMEKKSKSEDSVLYRNTGYRTLTFEQQHGIRNENVSSKIITPLPLKNKEFSDLNGRNTLNADEVCGNSDGDGEEGSVIKHNRRQIRNRSRVSKPNSVEEKSGLKNSTDKEHQQAQQQQKQQQQQQRKYVSPHQSVVRHSMEEGTLSGSGCMEIQKSDAEIQTEPDNQKLKSHQVLHPLDSTFNVDRFPVKPFDSAGHSRMNSTVAEETKRNSGIAGAIAQLSLSAGDQTEPSTDSRSLAYQEYLRRQNWETGNIDYMGKDSFENIWCKIRQTLDQKAPKQCEGLLSTSEKAAAVEPNKSESTGTRVVPEAVVQPKQVPTPNEAPLPTATAVSQAPKPAQEQAPSIPLQVPSPATTLGQDQQSNTEQNKGDPIPVTAPVTSEKPVPSSSPNQIPAEKPVQSSAQSEPSIPAPAARTQEQMSDTRPSERVPAAGAPVGTTEPTLQPQGSSLPALVNRTAPKNAVPVSNLSAIPSISETGPDATTQKSTMNAPMQLVSITETPPTPIEKDNEMPSFVEKFANEVKSVESKKPSDTQSGEKSVPTTENKESAVVPYCDVFQPGKNAQPDAPQMSQHKKNVEEIIKHQGEPKSAKFPPIPLPETPTETIPADGIFDSQPAPADENKKSESSKDAGKAKTDTQGRDTALVPYCDVFQPAKNTQPDGSQMSQHKKNVEEIIKHQGVPKSAQFPPIPLPESPTDARPEFGLFESQKREEVTDGQKPEASRSESPKDEGKAKKGMISKILEIVGVSPKETKPADDVPKSVFYDADKKASNAEQTKEGSVPEQSATKTEGGDAIAANGVQAMTKEPENDQKALPQDKVENDCKKDGDKRNFKRNKNKSPKPPTGKNEEPREVKQHESKKKNDVSGKGGSSPPQNNQKNKSPKESKDENSGKKNDQSKPPESTADSSAASVLPQEGTGREGKRKSPSPKLSIPASKEQPDKNSALLTVDNTIPETPPVSNQKSPKTESTENKSLAGSVISEIDQIIDKAKTVVESQLEETKNTATAAVSEAADQKGTDIVNALKLIADDVKDEATATVAAATTTTAVSPSESKGSKQSKLPKPHQEGKGGKRGAQKPTVTEGTPTAALEAAAAAGTTATKPVEMEELKVTSEEDRKKHKSQAAPASKLSDQILKAIPPPRRKVISDAKAEGSSESCQQQQKEAETQKPQTGKGAQKQGGGKQEPVPPPRNRSRPPHEAPPKGKTKK